MCAGFPLSNNLASRSFSESDFYHFLIRWCHELTDCVKHDPELRVVFFLKFIEAFRKVAVGRDHLSQAHKRPHDLEKGVRAF